MSHQRKFLNQIAITLIIASLALVAGCAKPKKADEEAIPTAPSADENIQTGDSDSGKAMGLETIHFPYDAFNLDSEAKKILKANVAILKDKMTVKIQVEGHCDQRGGIQYNIALGEKRANAVKKYMEDLGVSNDRITTISFGKERPLDPSENESAYGKNRRANFVITTK